MGMRPPGIMGMRPPNIAGLNGGGKGKLVAGLGGVAVGVAAEAVEEGGTSADELAVCASAAEGDGEGSACASLDSEGSGASLVDVVELSAFAPAFCFSPCMARKKKFNSFIKAITFC